ncbi:solute carrier family 35 member D3 [Colossoma macropomum]|uniref:solute carrier family 35 member D3 n=1 Tax=Colossoma macropomum TaxID=42526 RepID=UPI001863FF96|nr:solute carrier family 35 member D3 [Colossoma macropomum]
MYISKCSVWLRVHCATALRVCVYKGYKSLAPLLPCGAAVVVVVLYSLADKLHSFVCGIFMPQYHYPYAVPLALIQMLLNLLALVGLHAAGLVMLKPFSLRLAERLMVPAVCGSFQSVLALWAEASSHSGLYPLTARLLPVLSLAWSHLLALTTSNNTHFNCILVAVTFISVTITAREGLYTIEPLEYLYSPLSLFLHSLSLAWLAKVAQSERGHTSIFDLYYTLTVTRSLLLGFLCLLHPDSPRAITDGSWHSLLFLGYMLGILLLGAVQVLMVDITALSLSGMAAALLHSARGLTLPLYNLL